MNKNVNLIKSKWNMTKNYFTAGRNWMKLSEILLIITLMVSLYKASQNYTLVIYIYSLIWFLPQQENKDPILLKKLYKVLMIWFTINSHMWKLMCFHPYNLSFDTNWEFMNKAICTLWEFNIFTWIESNLISIRIHVFEILFFYVSNDSTISVYQMIFCQKLFKELL